MEKRVVPGNITTFVPHPVAGEIGVIHRGEPRGSLPAFAGDEVGPAGGNRGDRNPLRVGSVERPDQEVVPRLADGDRRLRLAVDFVGKCPADLLKSPLPTVAGLDERMKIPRAVVVGEHMDRRENIDEIGVGLGKELFTEGHIPLKEGEYPMGAESVTLGLSAVVDPCLGGVPFTLEHNIIICKSLGVGIEVDVVVVKSERNVVRQTQIDQRSEILKRPAYRIRLAGPPNIGKLHVIAPALPHLIDEQRVGDPIGKGLLDLACVLGIGGVPDIEDQTAGLARYPLPRRFAGKR